MTWFNNRDTDVISIKYIELGIALYMGISALIFLILPEVLRYPVYDPWRTFGIGNWGLVMLSVAFLHLGGLIWNGLNPLMSRVFRTLACVLHLSTMISFGVFFAESGAVWGMVLFLFLLPFSITPVILRLTGEIKWLREGNQNG